MNKRMSVAGLLKKQPSSMPLLEEIEEDIEDSEDAVNARYEAILDKMLTTPQMKEQLMNSQSLEKKKQFIKLNKAHLDVGVWGDAEDLMLTQLGKAKLPDLNSLSTLKQSLKSANKEFMNSFLEAGGISVLLTAMENRVKKQPISELDVAILYEILSCCKAVMNNAVGMDGFLSVEGSVNIIARSLNFEFKPYSLLVLEILSVCCYYSDKAASLVVEGMRQHAIHNREACFSSLSTALTRQDIEIKFAVMQFVNNMIMGVADLNARSAVRNDLNCQLFGQNYDVALKCVESELISLKEMEGHVNEPHMKLKRKSMITIHGSKAYNEKKVESLMSKTSLVGVVSDRGSIVGTNVEVRSNGAVMKVNPLQGTMAGLLIAAKNTEKIEAKIIDVFGGKKTKRRWFELDADNFKWCAGHEKEAEYKGSVPIGSIIDIRPHTNDHSVMESSSHAFEIETTERSYAFGCESAKERDSWVTALETGRDRHMINKGSYLLQLKELTLSDVEHFAGMFRKQGQVYHSISVEDKKQLIASNGLDLSDVHAVSSFLQSETVAAGTNSKLLFILQELLLIPGGADGTWDAIVTGIKRVRESNSRTPTDAQTSFITVSNVETLNSKASASGGIYSQVSKLALTTFACEQELSRLKKILTELEANAETLAKEKSELETALLNSKSQILKRPNDTFMLNHSDSSRVSESTGVQGGSMASGSSGGGGSAEPLNPNYVPVTDSSVAALDERFAKYDKMRKLMPEGAVRQKMAADGYSEGQIELYFCGQTVPLVVPPVKPAKAPPIVPSAPPPPVPTSTAAPAANERFAKYDKMRKMLPEGAVRQKMSADGLSEAEIESYFDGSGSAAVGASGTVASSLSAVFPTIAPPPIPSSAPPVPPPAAAAVVADERFAKFDKMRKMLPEGAVRQKMMTEGFTPDEIDAYFNGTLPAAQTAVAQAPPPPAAPALVDERFAKFDKMRKMLPEGAVRQKMMTEGFKPEEIDAYFNGTLPAAAAPVAVAPAALDERYVKYDKMRKMLPEGAVRQKMMQDGFTPAEIDAFCADVIITAVTPASALPPPPAPVDPRFEKYDKMRKMLPEGAVRQKMMQDGFKPDEIESFFSGGGGAAPSSGGAGGAGPMGGGISAAALAGGIKKPAVPAAPVVELPPEGMTAKPKVVPKLKLKGIFWTKLKAAEVPGTIWHKLKDFQLAAADTSRLEEWFAAKVSDTLAANEKDRKAKEAAAAPKLISVLDGKRTQNALLIIGKIRKEPEGLVQMVIDLDPNVLNQEMTTSMFAILPTPEELAAIKDHHDPSILDLASKVLYQFNRVPRLQQRIECHDIAFNWFNTANGINDQLGVILKAQDELVSSQKSMETILAMVLSIGNYINGDTARGQAYGVKLDIFMKMSNLKAALPSQGSLMHFLAIMAENHSIELTTINEKWMAIAGAAEVSLKQVNTDFMALEGQVNKMNTEFTRIKEGKENVGLDGVLEDIRGKCTQPLHKRLDKFLKEAKPKVSALKDLNKKVEEKVELIMNKYGESLKALSEEDPCKRFFGMISSFGRQFSAAVEDNRVAREAAEKAAKALAEAERKLAGPAAMAVGDSKAAAAAGLAAAMKKKGPVENIFGNFHKNQAASSDDVLEEFKRKMLMRQQKQ